ncbi:N-acetyl sugar amidotransferase [Paenibacillus sp. JMULE4]|nr:N-acetyl sugar amidotransferase [Paenibacillus sp. JMULE4]
MDTSDPDITFNNMGVCNHCIKYDRLKILLDDKNIYSESKLEQIIEKIKKDGKNKQYDCIIGVSGGVDSTYVAYKVKEYGLRPLAVHLDNSWNSELAVSNIEKTLKKLNIDLYTHVLDWEEFKDLQLSFLKASVPDMEIPTDHAIVSLLYKMAAKEKTRYIIMGTNIATEAIMPSKWAAGHTDWMYIKSIHNQFGKSKLKDFPHYSMLDYAKYKLVYKQKEISLLNYINYNKAEAMEIIEEKLDWKNYGGKHFESIYTRFIQSYVLPVKFGIDKRKAHLSTLICSGQMTREEALKELEHDSYPLEKVNEDKQYVLKKFGLSESEFDQILNSPKKYYMDYPNMTTTLTYKIGKKLYEIIRK